MLNMLFLITLSDALAEGAEGPPPITPGTGGGEDIYLTIRSRYR